MHNPVVIIRVTFGMSEDCIRLESTPTGAEPGNCKCNIKNLIILSLRGAQNLVLEPSQAVQVLVQLTHPTT